MKTKKKRNKVTPTQSTAVSTIRVTFEGLLVLFIDKSRTYCDVGILKYAPNHMANLLITKIPKLGAPETITHLHDADMESRLWLDVPRFEAVINLFRNDSVRFVRATDHGDPQDFRWVLDFEGSEMYGVEVEVDSAGFKSILRINDGTFFTQEKSWNRLIVIKDGKEKDIGRVATRIRAEIPLYGSQKAYFSNGAIGTPIELEAEMDTDFGIYVSQIRHNHAAVHGPSESDEVDGNYYNSAMAANVPPNQKIRFARGNEVTPDAACFTGSTGQGGP